MGEQRHDLGESLFQLGRRVLDAEREILDRLELDMWEYAVLTELSRGPARSQSELAAAVGRDKTRLIPILDRLGGAGLVERTPDPADRRNRIVTVTGTGRDTLRTARRAVRRMETELMSGLSPAERAAFVGLLERLAWDRDGPPGAEQAQEDQAGTA